MTSNLQHTKLLMATAEELETISCIQKFYVYEEQYHPLLMNDCIMNPSSCHLKPFPNQEINIVVVGQIYFSSVFTAYQISSNCL